MPAPKNLTGQRFGRLIARQCVGIDKHHNRLWRCDCDCGATVTTKAGALVSGTTKSCGCYNRDRVSEATRARNLKHGQSHRGAKTRVYTIWTGLAFRRYKKPVPVCNRWRASFEDFLADMGEPPSPKHTIDRLDNAKGYEPGNCRWATMQEQQNNRTNNRLITFQGRTQTLQQWANETGLAHKIILHRLENGWPLRAVFLQPANGKRFTPVAPHNSMRLAFAGQTRTVKEWAKLTGLAPATIKQRVNRYGWSVEKALTTRPHKGR